MHFFREELSQDEFEALKEETYDQIKEFSETLDRMNKGDVSLNNKLSTMKTAIRSAISKSFNTIEMIKMFGAQDSNALVGKLSELEQEYRTKKISADEMESKKIIILNKILELGQSISDEDKAFLERRRQLELQGMEEINDE